MRRARWGVQRFRSFLGRARHVARRKHTHSAMDLHPKQFVRVNVKAATGNGVERVFERTFSVDPRTITLDRLRHLIARALNIRDEFSMVALRRESDQPLPLSCDWDLEGALSDEPNMDLLLELQPNEPGFEEWDIICPADVPVAGHEASVPTKQRAGSFLEQIFLHMSAPPSPYVPLTLSEFESLEEWECALRYAVYRAGGAEEEVRPRLWLHLLDVFPRGAGREEKAEFLNRKAEEYYRLRHSWQKLVQAGTIPAILQDVTGLIRKDVKRTDRVQGLDERALYNVLTTYAVHHPPVGYCQGMSDLLSPLLRVMGGSEPRAYLAFCGLMRRMRDNFRPDGRSVLAKFRHLRRAIRAHDPQLYEHMRGVGALDLLFCYRWLLLDLKREFPYEEMLRLQEVLWSTFRPIASEKGVELYEEPFPTPSVWESLQEKEVDPRDRIVFTNDHFGTPKQTDHSALTSLKRWAILSRRQSIAKNIEESSSSSTEDEDGGIVHYRQYRRTKRRGRRRSECRSWSGRDCSLKSPCFYSNTVHDIRIDSWLEDMRERRRHGSSDSNYESNLSEEEEEDEESPSRGRSEGYISGHEDISPLNSFDSADTYFNSRRTASLLPGPCRLGDGKPFLIFLCLTMILGHRDALLRMDANEMGMYFDRLVRGHRLADVLPGAKAAFEEYLRSGWTDED